MTELASLLERVKAASGPDREIDAALLKVSDPSLDVRRLSVWRGEMCCGSLADCLPPFTASLDAALALVEREFSGGLGWWVEMETAGMGAVLHGPDGEEFKGGGVGKDLPTALLAALLSALITQESRAHCLMTRT